MPSSAYDLVVIGGGSAGLTAAKFATTFGKSAVIIEKAKLGGDCTFYGCIPSKSILASAKVANIVNKSKKFGIDNIGSVSVDAKAVRDRIQNNINTIYEEDDSPEAMKKLGIDTIEGTAQFEDDSTVLVVQGQGGTQTVTANCGIIIATGAGPKCFENNIQGLDEVKFLTYEEAFNLEELPKEMTVVGGGPVGCELAQAFSRLGSDVTIIAPRLLPEEEPEISNELKTVFAKEGIRVIESKLTGVQSFGMKGSHEGVCANGEKVKGETLLLAVGRRPIVEGMGLEKVGVELNESGGIRVRDDLRTSVPTIYAAGDVTGDKQFTHYAGYQGAVSARNILLPLSDQGKLPIVPATTFTDPEISSVGLTESQAIEKYGAKNIAISVKKLDETDRGICEGCEEGIIKIIYKKRGCKILGAHIMSPVAGEMISEIGIMMKFGISFDKLATVMHTYPSHSFVLQAMAAEVYYDKLTKSKGVYNFLKKLGL